jgi:DNA replication protein DnaD
MEKILSDWFDSGCKTLQDCIARSNETKSVLKSEKTKESNPKPSSKKKTPRYGDFDPEEALKKALERSFSNSEE